MGQVCDKYDGVVTRQELDHLENLTLGVRVILNYILKEMVGSLWNVFIWLWIWTSSRFL